jgi:thiamine-phosphate pyrophosphorylase
MKIDRLHYISQARLSTATEPIEPTANPHLAAIEKVLLAGGKWVQLRLKNLTEEEVLPLAIEAVALCKAHDARLIVNDYPLVALKSGAYGLHLGLDDMPIAKARAIVGPEMIIGGTANTLAQLQLRADEGADYIGLGPYRFTHTKQNLSPVIGLEGYVKLMAQMKAAGISIPIVAIGGIEAADIPLLLQAGLHGVAVSGALTNREDTELVINEMQEMFAGAHWNINPIKKS